MKLAQGKGTRRETERNRNRANGRRDRTGERRTKGNQRTADEGEEPGGQTGNRRRAHRGTGGREGEAPDHPVRVRGFGAARIYGAAATVLGGLREPRIVSCQLSGGQQPSLSRAPYAALPRALCGLLIRRPQLTQQSWLLVCAQADELLGGPLTADAVTSQRPQKWHDRGRIERVLFMHPPREDFIATMSGSGAGSFRARPAWLRRLLASLAAQAVGRRPADRAGPVPGPGQHRHRDLRRSQRG